MNSKLKHEVTAKIDDIIWEQTGERLQSLRRMLGQEIIKQTDRYAKKRKIYNAVERNVQLRIQIWLQNRIQHRVEDIVLSYEF